MPARRDVAARLRIPGIAQDVHMERAFEVVEYARSQPMGPDVSEWLARPISELRDRVLLGSVAGDEIRTELRAIQQRHDQGCPYCSTLH